MSNKLEVGTRIYYTGDMANWESEGVVVKCRMATKYGPESVDILFDDKTCEDDTDKLSLGVSLMSFEPGPGRRFWELSEWKKDRLESIRKSQKRMNDFLARSRGA